MTLLHRLGTAVLLALACCSIACGGQSTRVSGSSERSGSGGTSGASEAFEGLVAAGDLHLLAARRDGSRIAYFDADNVVWVVAPGETPTRVYEFDSNAISATFAREADALVVLGDAPDLVLFYWTPDDGGTLIGRASYFGSISYGGALLYVDPETSQVMLWRPSQDQIALGEPPGWMTLQANGTYGVVLTTEGLLGVELATGAVQTLAPSSSHVALSGDGSTVAFLSDPEPLPAPAEGSACCTLRVVDLADGSTLVEEPAKIDLFHPVDGRAVFFLGDSAGSPLRRIALDGTPSIEFGKGPVIQLLAASPDLRRIIYRDLSFMDYEFPVAIQEEGGSLVARSVGKSGSPMFFRHGSKLVVSAPGGPPAPEFALSIMDIDDGARSGAPWQKVATYVPMLDDDDGVLFGTGDDLRMLELHVGDTVTKAEALVSEGVFKSIQVSGRRLVAELRGETTGIYVLPIPVP